MTSSSKGATEIAPESHTNTKPSQTSTAPNVQTFLLVWLDGNIDNNSDKDCRNTIIQLRRAVNTIKTFTDIDRCIHFLTNIKDEKVLTIISGTFGAKVVPMIHDEPQIDSIYIFCGDTSRHEQWSKQWSKIKGLHTEILPLCQALKRTVQQEDQNSISISFVSTNDDSLNQLDQSFMYTEILKEIILEIDFDRQSLRDFANYCRKHLNRNADEQDFVQDLERNYRHHSPIWWYTRESFLYSELNRALRTMEIDFIIKTGFFVRDLHEQIARLHSEQYNNHSISFTVYRGQGLSEIDLNRMKKTKGGLLSFNNFLSTSKNPNVAMDFICNSLEHSDMTGILFVMSIDISISSTPFASINKISYYAGTEEEILFSMHTVFRIGDIRRIEHRNHRLWEVRLTLTSDNDPQLRALTERIREETQPDEKGLFRLGELLIKLGQFKKAQQVYEEMLPKTTKPQEKADIHHQIGNTKVNQGRYDEAITFYEKALQIYQKILPPNHPDLGVSYNNIGLVYNKIGDFSQALSSHEKALRIREISLDQNHPHLASSYNEIGVVYEGMGDYSKALQFNERALEIYKRSLPSNHPDLATSYNNIGMVYDKTGDYDQALSFYEKALQIWQKSLPSDHPNLATGHTNIGIIYDKTGEHSKALLSLRKALKIREKILPHTHPDLAMSYGHLGWVLCKTGEQSEAASFCELAIDIGQRSLPENHPRLQLWRKNLETAKNTF